MSRLTLSLLGPPRIERDGKGVQVDTRKAMALLAYLAITNQPHSREKLATLFWPDSHPARAYANLRQALWILNKALDGNWLVADSEIILLDRSAGMSVDVDAFHDLLAESESHGHPAGKDCPACLAFLAEAATLYRGDFMAGFTLPNSPEFDEWQFFQAESLHRELASVLQRLARGYVAHGELEPAITYARRWVALDPLHEPAHRQLMRLYADNGQRNAALRQYQECVRLLQEELGVAPEAETTALYNQIKEGRREPLRQEPLSSPASPPPIYPLPAQPTPFVGRQEELAEIVRLLQDPECRLVTLVGPGGVGKTRLALQAVADLTAAFPDGVCFVPLGALGSPDRLAATLLDAVQPAHEERDPSEAAGSRDIQGKRRGRGTSDEEPDTSQPGRTGGERLKRRLLGYIHERQLLLVLDNLEHLLAGVGLLAEILAYAPEVKILATSRERLNLRAEWLLDVRGLPFPAGEELISSYGGMAFEAYPAIALFLQTVRQVRPDFQLAEADRPCVLRLCQLVEGLPLALELAAAWARMLSCAEITREIEQGLDFLAGPSRDVPERHRSLRAVFDHSWRLLDEAERRAFRKLSAFRGGFGREAAEQVAGAGLALLSALADKSFLGPTARGRYAIHPLLRQYGEEQLQAVPEEWEATRDRHSRYHAALLQNQQDLLKGSRQQEAVAALSAEIENVRAGWDWAVKRGLWADVGRSLESLFLFYDTVSWFEEGEAAFRAAVEALPPATTPDLLGKLLARLGVFSFRLGQFETARKLILESLALARQAADRSDTAFALNWLGAITTEVGNYRQARKVHEESLALHREAGDRWGMAIALSNLGTTVQRLGQYSEARQFYQESLALKEAIGDRRGMVFTLNDLTFQAILLGDYAEGRRMAEKSVAIAREIGDAFLAAPPTALLASVAQGTGDYDTAERLGEDSGLRLVRLAGPVGLGHVAILRGELACARGEYAEARRLFEDGLTAFREDRTSEMRGYLLNHLGGALALAGDAAGAERRYREGLAIYRKLGHPLGTATSLAGLGRVALLQSTPDEAVKLGQESLALARETGSRRQEGEALALLGQAAQAQGDEAEAWRRLQEALRLAAEMDARPLALEVLAQIAGLETRRGDQDLAADLLALVAGHPAATHAVRECATTRLGTLAPGARPAPAAEDALLAEAVELVLRRNG